jgi:hypothetical protein
LGLGTGLIKMPPLRHNHGHHHLPPYAMHASSGQPRVWAQAHRQHRQLRPSAPAGHLHHLATWKCREREIVNGGPCQPAFDGTVSLRNHNNNAQPRFVALKTHTAKSTPHPPQP